jgi:hypothetical protein
MPSLWQAELAAVFGQSAEHLILNSLLIYLGTGKTLIQNTYERFLKVCPKENIYVVTNENYTGLVKNNCRIWRISKY